MDATLGARNMDPATFGATIGGGIAGATAAQAHDKTGASWSTLTKRGITATLTACCLTPAICLAAGIHDVEYVLAASFTCGASGIVLLETLMRVAAGKVQQIEQQIEKTATVTTAQGTTTTTTTSDQTAAVVAPVDSVKPK